MRDRWNRTAKDDARDKGSQKIVDLLEDFQFPNSATDSDSESNFSKVKYANETGNGSKLIGSAQFVHFSKSASSAQISKNKKIKNPSDDLH